MLLSAVSVLVVTQSSSEIPEGLMNNPVLQHDMRARSVMELELHPFILSVLDVSGPLHMSAALLPSKKSLEPLG